MSTPIQEIRTKKACQNTDREIWRRKSDDLTDPDSYYQPSIHVTAQGAIGINVGGSVIVMPVENWHATIAAYDALAAEKAAERAEFMAVTEKIGENRQIIFACANEFEREGDALAAKLKIEIEKVNDLSLLFDCDCDSGNGRPELSVHRQSCILWKVSEICNRETLKAVEVDPQEYSAKEILSSSPRPIVDYHRGEGNQRPPKGDPTDASK